MLVFLIVVIGLSLLILSHEAGHFFVAKLFKLKIDEFGFGFPPRIFAKKKGETEYSLNWLPFGGFVRISGENDHMDKSGGGTNLSDDEKKRFFNFQPAWKRSLIILAGVTVNFLIGWFMLSMIFMVGRPPALVIADVQPGSPAAAIGILPGDLVKNFTTADEFISFINQNKGKSFDLEILRGGKELKFTATPRIDVSENEGALGVYLAEAGVPKQPFLVALSDGFRASMNVALMTVTGFYALVTGLLFKATLVEGIVGPVGIFSVAQGASSVGFIYLLQLIAVISINLSIVNLLPFPALDGGRFFMILIEKLKGSPISKKTESVVNTLGFVFLIALMVIITFNDILSL